MILVWYGSKNKQHSLFCAMCVVDVCVSQSLHTPQTSPETRWQCWNRTGIDPGEKKSHTLTSHTIQRTTCITANKAVTISTIINVMVAFMHTCNMSVHMCQSHRIVAVSSFQLDNHVYVTGQANFYGCSVHFSVS